MREPSHPLDRPLPPDVAAGESAFIQYYQKYTVFSWTWALRRTLVFGSLGVLAAVSFGVSHGLFVRSVAEAISVSAVCAGANILLVGAGPVLAAFFRHRGWRKPIEGALIVGAVIFGIAAGAISADWAGQFHDARMADHGHHSEPKMQAAMDLHRFVQMSLDVSVDLFILFICSGGFALPAYFSEKKRWAEHRRRAELEKLSLQKSEADMKLTVLQAQVEPHFLFNTLASVRSLVTTDPQRAAQTIDALAQHLRATMPRLRADTGIPQSTLGEQFNICSSYLELMKVRLGERLQVDVKLPADLRDAAFPPLLLISLVENAIKHGVEPKPGVTRVGLIARNIREGDCERIEVQVEDDGAGLRPGMGQGTGLANVRAQLLTRFGAAATFELLDRAGGGVFARITIPHERHPP